MGAGITDPSYNGITDNGAAGVRAPGYNGPAGGMGAGITDPGYNGADDGMKIGRVIGAADEWTGGDMREAFAAGDVAVEIELLRRDVLDDRQVLRRRAKILAQGQDLAAHFAQIIHCLEKFRFRLAKP